MGDPGKGDHVERSLDDLTWEAYQELRATARRRLRRERGYRILQTTALRTKRRMRRVLVDHACAWNSTAAPPIRMPRSLGGGTPFPPPPPRLVFLPRLELAHAVAAGIGYPDAGTVESYPGRSSAGRKGSQLGSIGCPQLPHGGVEGVRHPDAGAAEDHAPWAAAGREGAQIGAIGGLQRSHVVVEKKAEDSAAVVCRLAREPRARGLSHPMQVVTHAPEPRVGGAQVAGYVAVHVGSVPVARL